METEATREAIFKGNSIICQLCEILLPPSRHPLRDYRQPLAGLSFALIESHAEFVSQAKNGNLAVQFSADITSLPAARAILVAVKHTNCRCMGKKQRDNERERERERERDGAKGEKSPLFLIAGIPAVVAVV